MKTLDRWEDWRVIKEAAAKVPGLEARVAELEEKLGGKWPADACPACGEQALRFSFSHANADKGTAIETWTCQSCDGEIKRPVKAR